jgi:hypothetical protein
MKTMTIILMTALLALQFAHAAWASKSGTSDYAKEQRWAKQVIDYLVDGEPLWLKAGNHNFISIYTPATVTQAHGAIVILHDQGTHPDWPHVIRPLRTKLPEQGWATLSIQLPVLANGADEEKYVPLFNDVSERINAAFNYLQQKGFNNLVLAGYGIGNQMALDYLGQQTDKRVKAFIGIDMNAMPKKKQHQALDILNGLLKLNVPVLDIYGSETHKPVLNSVNRRAFVVYQYPPSRQIEIQGADHLFQGYENKMMQAITGWLTKVAPVRNAGTNTKNNENVMKNASLN